MLLWSVSKSLGTTCLGKMSVEELCALSQSSSNGVEHRSGVVMPSLAGWQSTLLGVPVNVTTCFSLTAISRLMWGAFQWDLEVICWRREVRAKGCHPGLY